MTNFLAIPLGVHYCFLVGGNNQRGFTLLLYNVRFQVRTMNKRLFMLMAAALALLSASGQVEFTGVGNYHVIKVTPDKSLTGLDAIYVVYDTDGVGMSYASTTGERASWVSFESHGGNIVFNDVATQWDGFSTKLPQVQSGIGYKIDNRYCCWIVNYADYYMSLNDLFLDYDKPCSLLSFRVDGSAPKIPYCDTYGRTHILDREIKLTYETREYNDSLSWQITPVEETFASLEDGLQIDPPLFYTKFTLSGDRFLEEWDIAESKEYDAYQVQAVGCGSTAIQTKTGERLSSSPVNVSAPEPIVFTGDPSEAVVYRKWEMATDEAFENVILQYTQDEVEYTFNEVGTYYMRYMVANDNGSCESYGETYTIIVSESQLGDETGRIPNVLSLGYGEWKVPHKSIIEFHCWIFNRWGNLVYEFTDPDSGWDGTYHGKYVDTGVYYCVVTATGSDGKEYKKRSDITVLRYKKGAEGTSNGVPGAGM